MPSQATEKPSNLFSSSTIQTTKFTFLPESKIIFSKRSVEKMNYSTVKKQILVSYPLKFKPSIEAILLKRLRVTNTHLFHFSSQPTEDEIEFALTCEGKTLRTIEEYKMSFDLCANYNAIHILESQPSDKIDWYYLAGNPMAVHILERNKDKLCKICWMVLSRNPNAISMIENNQDKVDWSEVSLNPNASHLLKQNKDKIDWDNVSMNPGAIELIEENMDKTNWEYLSMNPSAIHLIKANLDKADWSNLSKNPAAIEILEQNQSKIDFVGLAENPNAVHLIKANLHKLSWYAWQVLSKNPNAIDILREHKHHINWAWLSDNPNAIPLLEEKYDEIYIKSVFLLKNPSIFIYDYEQMRRNMSIIFEDLMKAALKPRRVIEWIEADCEEMLC